MCNIHYSFFWASVIAVRNPPYLNSSGQSPPNLDFRETEQPPPPYHLLVDYEIFFFGCFLNKVYYYANLQTGKRLFIGLFILYCVCAVDLFGSSQKLGFL